MTTQTLNPTAPSAVPNVLADRADFRAIAHWIEPRSTVLDLGRGDGSLLCVLQDELDVLAYGIEIDDAGVLAFMQKGVRIVQQNMEGGLALFEDESFDAVIPSQTLQTIYDTAQVLHGMLCIGRECIMSLPDFGYWLHRLSVLRGHMPVSKSLPYEWYNTPNVRVLTIRGFEALASKVGLVILDHVVLHGGNMVHWDTNWRGSVVMYRVRTS